MRRFFLFGLLSLFSTAAPAALAYGDEPQPWTGRQVLLRSARVHPRSSGHATARVIVCVRTVQRVKGDWLLVGDGWMRSSEVVPLDEAIGWFTAQIERRPSSFDYLSRAAAHGAQGNYEASLSDCDAALRINPRLYAAYYHRAAARAAQGQFTEAIRDYDAALRLDPRLAGAYVDRGAARLKLGDYAGSLADVNYALRLSPRESDAYYVRGVARFYLHQYRGAVSDLNYALRANPARVAAYDTRGLCKEKLGQFDDALKDFGKAVELDPANANARSHHERLRIARAATQ